MARVSLERANPEYRYRLDFGNKRCLYLVTAERYRVGDIYTGMPMWSFKIIGVEKLSSCRE